MIVLIYTDIFIPALLALFMSEGRQYFSYEIFLSREETRGLRKNSALKTVRVHNSEGSFVPRSVRIQAYEHGHPTLASVDVFPEGADARNATHYDIALSKAACTKLASWHRVLASAMNGPDFYIQRSDIRRTV